MLSSEYDSLTVRNLEEVVNHILGLVQVWCAICGFCIFPEN
jgi:hypothetical protein